MAEATLVNMQLTEGQRLIDRLAQNEVAVTAAAWVKESESGDWYLYLATPLVGEGGGKKAAYHRVNEVIREMQEEGFGMDPFAKKVIGPNDPIAKDLLTHRVGRPGGSPTTFRGNRLGDLAVEEAYIYPRPPAPEEAAGMLLWERGHSEFRPGVGPAGLCRVVVIDLEDQAVLQDRRYRGTMLNPQPLPNGQAEVTWTEGGAVRIVGADKGSIAPQRWRWSQSNLVWEDGGCPRDTMLHAILTAMG
jgi:hypothetical protein